MISKLRNRITVEVAGGLGNQLFCYFAGYVCAETQKVNLNIDLLYASKAHSKEYDLTSFQLPGSFTDYNYESIRNIKKLLWRISDSLAHKSKQYSLLRQSQSTIYREQPRSNYDPELIHKIKPGYRMKGFFTTCEYLEYLQKNNKFRTLELRSPSSWFQRVSRSAIQLRPIMIHVRRGDFLQNKDTYGVLSEQYYQAALKKAFEIVGERSVWLFSDDIEYVRNWKMFRNYDVFAVGNTDLQDKKQDPAEHLKLMTYASINIVSNSSFSLFGALLNPNSEATICPSSSTKMKELDLNSFYPSSWLRISADWE
jgi:hypothetical protein